MALVDLIDNFKGLDVFSHVGLDDLPDRLSFLHSVCLLTVISSVCAAKTFFLNPISCYMPNTFGQLEGQLAFVTSMCFTDGTYNVPPSEFKTDSHSNQHERAYSDRKIIYYQWLPFILGVQAIMFYAPNIVWQTLSRASAGGDFGQALKTAADAQQEEEKKRDGKTETAAQQMTRWLRSQGQNLQTSGAGAVGCIGRCFTCRVGFELTLLYLLIKCVYLLNCLGQLALVTRTLTDGWWNRNRTIKDLLIDASKFGPQLLRKLLDGEDWSLGNKFPRSGMCAVKLRMSASAQYAAAQCSLPVNMLYEKIFIFLLFWLSLILIVTSLGIVMWLWRLLTCRRRCRRLLAFGGRRCFGRDVDKFLSSFLRLDGCFLLLMVATNCGDAAAADLCNKLYQMYSQELYHQVANANENNDSHVIDINSKKTAANTKETLAVTRRAGVRDSP